MKGQASYQFLAVLLVFILIAGGIAGSELVQAYEDQEVMQGVQDGLLKKLDTSQEKVDALQVQLDSANAKIAELQAQLDKITQEKSRAESEVTALRDELSQYKTQAEQFRDELDKAKAETEQLRAQVQTLTAERDGLKAQIRDLQAQLNLAPEQPVAVLPATPAGPVAQVPVVEATSQQGTSQLVDALAQNPQVVVLVGLLIILAGLVAVTVLVVAHGYVSAGQVQQEEPIEFVPPTTRNDYYGSTAKINRQPAPNPTAPVLTHPYTHNAEPLKLHRISDTRKNYKREHLK
jgi:septal ring factor EnvC (AmiA/AmiB activator)